MHSSGLTPKTHVRNCLLHYRKSLCLREATSACRRIDKPERLCFTELEAVAFFSETKSKASSLCTESSFMAPWASRELGEFEKCLDFHLDAFQEFRSHKLRYSTVPYCMIRGAMYSRTVFRPWIDCCLKNLVIVKTLILVEKKKGCPRWLKRFFIWR